MKTRILLVEDEEHLAEVIKLNLELEGYEVEVADNGTVAIKKALEQRFNLIVLDVMLPEVDGFEVCEKIRLEGNETPILFLTAKDSGQDKIHGLKLGADDYLVKPFRTGELLARMRSLLRSSVSESEKPIITINDIQIDLALRVVKKNNETVKLTVTEYNLLALLIRNEGKVLTHQFLLRSIWGPSYINQSQYLRVFIAQLRKKIEDDANKPLHIITESGIGYRFV